MHHCEAIASHDDEVGGGANNSSKTKQQDTAEQNLFEASNLAIFVTIYYSHTQDSGAAENRNSQHMNGHRDGGFFSCDAEP